MQKDFRNNLIFLQGNKVRSTDLTHFIFNSFFFAFICIKHDINSVNMTKDILTYNGNQQNNNGLSNCRKGSHKIKRNFHASLGIFLGAFPFLSAFLLRENIIK